MGSPHGASVAPVCRMSNKVAHSRVKPWAMNIVARVRGIRWRALSRRMRELVGAVGWHGNGFRGGRRVVAHNVVESWVD